jgi:hypothetical protein
VSFDSRTEDQPLSRFLTPRARPALASRLARVGLAAGIAAPALAALTAPASAQSSPCMDIQKHIEERKAIVARLQALGGKKKSLDPKEACALFGKLVVNGNSTLKWAETNKDWCQVPDSFVEGMKNDHNRATSLKGQACRAAAKQAEMERKARQQAQQGGGSGGLLGGPGLSGEYKIPQGAL